MEISSSDFDKLVIYWNLEQNRRMYFFRGHDLIYVQTFRGETSLKKDQFFFLSERTIVEIIRDGKNFVKQKQN